MTLPVGLIPKLTLIAVIFEVLHRIVIALINTIRLIFDKEYRDNALGDEPPHHDDIDGELNNDCAYA